MLIIAAQFLMEWGTDSRESMVINPLCPQQSRDFEHISVRFTPRAARENFQPSYLGREWGEEKRRGNCLFLLSNFNYMKSDLSISS